MFLPFPKILKSYFIWVLSKRGLHAMSLLIGTKSRDVPVCCGCGVPRTLPLWKWLVPGTVAIVQVRNSEEKKKSPNDNFYKVIHLLLMTAAVERFPHTWVSLKISHTDCCKRVVLSRLWKVQVSSTACSACDTRAIPAGAHKTGASCPAHCRACGAPRLGQCFPFTGLLIQ